MVAAHTLTRQAALLTRNEAPSAQWRALSVLQTEGPMRLGELARQCRATQPGMTRLIGQLEAAGLVRRDGDPSDSRVTVVSVTDAGITALAAWRIQLRDALEPMFEGLDDDDWAALSRVAHILTSRTTLEKTAR